MTYRLNEMHLKSMSPPSHVVKIAARSLPTMWFLLKRQKRFVRKRSHDFKTFAEKEKMKKYIPEWVPISGILGFMLRTSSGREFLVELDAC